MSKQEVLNLVNIQVSFRAGSVFRLKNKTQLNSSLSWVIWHRLGPPGRWVGMPGSSLSHSLPVGEEKTENSLELS